MLDPGYAVNSVVTSFAIITLKKIELVALLDCLLVVMWLLVFCVTSSRCHGMVCNL